MTRSKQLARTASALICGLALATGAAAQTGGETAATPAAAPVDQGEPLPPGAPTDPYELTGWCYGALAEYLQIYDQVKPDLVAIDKMFGSPVKEAEPYQSDVKVYHDELKVFGEAIVAAEKASPQVISGRGAAAIRAGQGIWQQAEKHSRRELARAWLSWGMPDACDRNARKLLASASLLGKALKYNQGHAENAAPANAPPAADNGSGPDGGGALVLAPIAPVVTHDAAAPSAPAPRPAMAGATRVPDEGAPVSTAMAPASTVGAADPLPAAPTPAAPTAAAPAPVATAEPPPAATQAAEPPPPAADAGPVMAAAQPSRRVVDGAPAATTADAPAAETPPAPPPVAAAEPQPVAASAPQRATSPAAAASVGPTPAPTADEPQEPVL